MKQFDYSLDYKTLDLRKQPELYRIGQGEHGVLMRTIQIRDTFLLEV